MARKERSLAYPPEGSADERVAALARKAAAHDLEAAEELVEVLKRLQGDAAPTRDAALRSLLRAADRHLRSASDAGMPGGGVADFRDMMLGWAWMRLGFDDTARERLGELDTLVRDMVPRGVWRILDAGRLAGVARPGSVRMGGPSPPGRARRGPRGQAPAPPPAPSSSPPAPDRGSPPPHRHSSRP